MIKIVTLFLVGIAVLAMFGRLRLPWRSDKPAPRKCRRCGGYIIGSGPCKCGDRTS